MVDIDLRDWAVYFGKISSDPNVEFNVRDIFKRTGDSATTTLDIRNRLDVRPRLTLTEVQPARIINKGGTVRIFYDTRFSDDLRLTYNNTEVTTSQFNGKGHRVRRKLTHKPQVTGQYDVEVRNRFGGFAVRTHNMEVNDPSTNRPIMPVGVKSVSFFNCITPDSRINGANTKLTVWTFNNSEGWQKQGEVPSHKSGPSCPPLGATPFQLTFSRDGQHIVRLLQPDIPGGKDDPQHGLSEKFTANINVDMSTGSDETVNIG